MTESPLIPIKTIPNHSLDVSRAFVILVSPESWPKNGMNQAKLSQQPSTQKPACFTTESPLIPIKTIPNHSWDVSRAFVMIEKQW
jgi:hypothetical protein